MRNFASIGLGLLTLVLGACGGDTLVGNGTNPGNGTTTHLSMGSGTGASFQSGAMAVSTATLSAGGSTSISVSIVDQSGVLYTQSATITFNSPCVAAGTAAINPQAAVTTTTGTATATYVAKGCAGSDVITATATANSQSLTAAGTVTVAQAAIGSIAYVSATPSNIALKGTGDAARPESSAVVFKVVDASGGPVAKANVSFALNTTVGGITLTPSAATATSDAQGLAQIVVNAGTVSTSVKVTATVTSAPKPISTQSSQLTITTGIPTANNFSVAVGCYNIEGWDLDGIQTTVTARLADRFQNPVPDGTAVTFHSKGAKIGPQCTTATTATESGVCSVTFTSQALRPSDGRVPLIATAIGEESFKDDNTNGAFDPGETFYDTSEPFEDDAQTGTYQLGDYFFDFNNNGTHDGPDGNFNGVLCNDPAHCNGPKSAGIGAKNIIILSGSTPVVDEVDAAGNVLAGRPVIHPGPVNFWVRDLHGNAMAGTTTVAASVTGNAPASFTLGNPSSFTVPCSAVPANTKDTSTVFPFSVSSTGGAGSGTLTLTVKTPSGLQTIFQIGVVSP